MLVTIGDIMCQTFPNYACTGKNHSSFHWFTIHFAIHFWVFKVTLKNNLIERKI